MRLLVYHSEMFNVNFSFLMSKMASNMLNFVKIHTSVTTTIIYETRLYDMISDMTRMNMEKVPSFKFAGL